MVRPSLVDLALGTSDVCGESWVGWQILGEVTLQTTGVGLRFRSRGLRNTGFV